MVGGFFSIMNSLFGKAVWTWQEAIEKEIISG
jgi:hypothetical protein